MNPLLESLSLKIVEESYFKLDSTNWPFLNLSTISGAHCISLKQFSASFGEIILSIGKLSSGSLIAFLT